MVMKPALKNIKDNQQVNETFWMT